MHISPHVTYFSPLIHIVPQIRDFFQESKFTSSGYGIANRVRPIWKCCLEAAERKARVLGEQTRLQLLRGPQRMEVYEDRDRNAENGARA